MMVMVTVTELSWVRSLLIYCAGICFGNYIYLTTINSAMQRGCLQQIKWVLCAINTIQFDVACGVCVITKGSYACQIIDVFSQIRNSAAHLHMTYALRQIALLTTCSNIINNKPVPAYLGITFLHSLSLVPIKKIKNVRFQFHARIVTTFNLMAHLANKHPQRWAVVHFQCQHCANVARLVNIFLYTLADGYFNLITENV